MDEKLERDLHRENMELSSISSRAIAMLIDDLLLSLIIIAIFWDTVVNAETIEIAINAINTAVLEIMVIRIIYQTFFIWYYSATIGKIIMKIRVINLDNFGRPNLMIALNRSIFRVISEMFFYIGYIIGIIDKSRRTLHDKTAKTIVVNDAK